MEIEVPNRKLEKQLSDEREMIKAFGKQRAQKLQARLAVLQAADRLSDVPRAPPDRCHQLSGDRDGCFAVDLGHPHRLIFEPAADPVPRKEDGGLDMDAVTSIRIIEIADYH
jgi:plasmid maintenance system killer protein